MKIAHLLCAIGLSAPLVLEASAAESPARVGSSAEAAGMAHAAASSAPGRDPASTKAVTATPRRNSGAAPRGVAELTRSNANRLQSLHRQEARGRVAKSPSRPIGPTRGPATARTAPARQQSGVSPVVPPKLSVSNNAVRTLPNLKVAPRGSTIGGPHVAGPGRVGGPATGRTANPAAIDGTQVHRKF
jgi:hypothetical protein